MRQSEHLGTAAGVQLSEVRCWEETGEAGMQGVASRVRKHPSGEIGTLLCSNQWLDGYISFAFH